MTTLEGWDAWLATLGGEAGFLQTSHWAALHEAVNGAKSHLILIEGGERDLAAGALMSFRPARRLPREGGPVPAGPAFLECYEGPVLAAGDRLGCLPELLRRVTELADRLGAGLVRFQGPPVTSRWLGDPAIASVFAEARYRETRWLSSLVELERSDG